MLTNALLVGAVLFCLGLVGILTRRNLIVMFLSAELMLQGVSVTLVAVGLPTLGAVEDTANVPTVMITCPAPPAPAEMVIPLESLEPAPPPPGAEPLPPLTEPDVGPVPPTPPPLGAAAPTFVVALLPAILAPAPLPPPPAAPLIAFAPLPPANRTSPTLPVVVPVPPVPYAVVAVFPIALCPPAPPLARMTEEGALTEFIHESPPETVASFIEELFGPPAPTLM
jgi:NADH:ubiquinone oxidoreductase subunit K